MKHAKTGNQCWVLGHIAGKPRPAGSCCNISSQSYPVQLFFGIRVRSFLLFSSLFRSFLSVTPVMLSHIFAFICLATKWYDTDPDRGNAGYSCSQNVSLTYLILLYQYVIFFMRKVGRHCSSKLASELTSSWLTLHDRQCVCYLTNAFWKARKSFGLPKVWLYPY